MPLADAVVLRGLKSLAVGHCFPLSAKPCLVDRLADAILSGNVHTGYGFFPLNECHPLEPSLALAFILDGVDERHSGSLVSDKLARVAYFVEVFHDLLLSLFSC